MQPRPARNNLLAGLFVLASVALAVTVSFMLSKGGAGPGATRFTVRMTIADGASGLQAGSVVNLGGQPVGRVASVSFDGSASSSGATDGETSTTAPTAVNVNVEVRKDITLYENASVFLEKPLLGTLSSINIAAPGTPDATPHQGSSARIENGEVIAASLAPPAFLTQAGIGSMQVKQIRETISNAQQAVERLSKLIDSSSPQVEVALADARTLIGDAKANLADWDKSMDTTLKNVEEASGKLSPLLDKGDKVLANADATVASAKALFDDARAVVSDNRHRIDEIIANVQATTSTINNESLKNLSDTLKDARSAMGEAQLAMSDVREIITQEGPNLRRTLANLRLMSDQFKIAAIEIRSHPWRLLHEPTTKELESQAIYDATRSYAAAASDVRAAAETVQAMSLAAKKNPSDANAGPHLDEATETLTKAMAQFRDAEQKLLDELIVQQNK